jgi:hypothetical protein
MTTITCPDCHAPIKVRQELTVERDERYLDPASGESVLEFLHGIERGRRYMVRTLRNRYLASGGAPVTHQEFSRALVANGAKKYRTANERGYFIPQELPPLPEQRPIVITQQTFPTVEDPVYHGQIEKPESPFRYDLQAELDEVDARIARGEAPF